MSNVALIFRGKDRNEVSIETLFECIEPYLSLNNDINNYFLPHGHFNKLKNFFRNRKYVKNIKADVYHITGEIYVMGLFTPKKKTIITVHDYVNLEIYKGIKKFISWLLWDYLPLKRCKYVACVSKKVYDETIDRFPFCKKKIFCIPNSIDDSFVYKPKDFNIKNVDILVVGTRSNKNLERIIEATRDLNCHLHIIGKLSEEQILLLKNNNSTYVNEYNVSYTRIREIYEECDILCFPSLYEGFGRPIIEANAIGRPVITSNIEPMVEVANGSACLVDPYSVESIRNGILKVCRDENYRKDLINKGLINSNKYKPSEIAKKYNELYEKIGGDEK